MMTDGIFLVMGLGGGEEDMGRLAGEEESRWRRMLVYRSRDHTP